MGGASGVEEGGVSCSPLSALPLPPWHGWEDGGGLWQEGNFGVVTLSLRGFEEWWVGIANLGLSPCPCRDLGSGGGWALHSQLDQSQSWFWGSPGFGGAAQGSCARGGNPSPWKDPCVLGCWFCSCLGVGQGCCLGIFHTREDWTAW